MIEVGQSNNISMAKSTSLIIVLIGLLLSQTTFAATLPADANTAQARLQASTRHGEWVDIPMEGTDVKLKSWVVYPERPDKAPVVLVIHEIFGLTDWVRAVADQLAAEGFIAVAPDFLSGMGPDGGGTESLGNQVGQKIREISQDEVAKRLNAARKYALALPAAGTKVGSVGFCWGGSASFNYAARQPELNAAAVYYGSAPTEKNLIEQLKAPVLGLYGGNDARINAGLPATEAAMKEANKPYTVNIYDGAGHGFLRQQNEPGSPNHTASQKAWDETIKFFKEKLETPK
jgi:carboxymethylenebutenolidase